MKLDGRRSSNNVEDRRGSGRGRTIAGIGGIGGLIIAALFVWLSGGNPLSVISQGGSHLLLQTKSEANTNPPRKRKHMPISPRKSLAGTEDVWTEEFKRWDSHIGPRKWCYTLDL